MKYLLSLIVIFTPLAALAADSEVLATSLLPAPEKIDHAPYAVEALHFYNEALELHRKGKFSDASERYKKSFAIDDRLWQAHSNYGLMLLAQKKYDEAAVQLRKALALRPTSVVSLNGYGVVLDAQKKYTDAEQMYKMALKMKPDFEAVYFNLVILYQRESREADAQLIRQAFKQQFGTEMEKRDPALSPKVDNFTS